jgi:hypothetical protein
MPRPVSSQVPQPIFHEPSFSEDKPTPDPTGFNIKHPSDTDTYKKVEDLLKKDIVAVPASRVADNQVFGLSDAYGAYGEGARTNQKSRKDHLSCVRRFGRL